MNDLQSTYTKILLALREQGRPSLTEGPEGQMNCMYRGDDGAKCAVGHLILEEVYSPRLEYWSVGSDPIMAALAASGIAPTHPMLNLLQACQIAHDSQLFEASLENWEQAMEQIAAEFSLTYTAPEALCLL